MMWKESYNIGVPSVDEQHRQLFDMVEGLFGIINANATNIKDECNKAIVFLKDYVVKHFNDEEAYLVSVNYEELDKHKLIHRDFVNTVLDYENKMVESDYDLATIKQFSGMLATWLIYHVAGEDRKYTEKLKKNASPQSSTYEDSFELSMKNVFSTLTGVSIEDVKKGDKVLSEDKLYVNVGLTGNTQGNATFVYPKETAFSLIENMTSMQIQEVDDMVVSALCEVANIVSGNAASVLAAAGIECDITTPSFAHTETETKEGKCIQFNTELGEIGVTISLEG